MRRARRTSIAALLLLSAPALQPNGGFAAFAQPGPEARNREPITRDILIAAAAKVVRAGPGLSRIWPGYWPEDQAFIFHAEGLGALLVSTGPRPASFQPVAAEHLPPELQGRAFFHQGTLPGAERPFVIGFSIGEGKSAMLVNFGSDSIKLLLHEQFHGFQKTAFKGAARQFVDPLAVKDRVAFAAAAETERSILHAAVIAADGEEQKRLLRDYFALRRERERTVPPEALEVERSFERIEGTARYAERAGEAVLSGAGEAGLGPLVAAELAKKLGANGGPYATTWFRLRGYSVGAALTYLIARLDPGNWRGKLEQGAAPDQLLEGLVGSLPPAGAKERADAARRRFGYERTRIELEPQIRAAEKAEIKSVADFLALQPFRLVLEAGSGASARPGFSARDMTPLSPSVLALRMAMRFNVAGDDFSLTARERPVLLESGKAPRYTILLPQAPRLSAMPVLQPGEHRFDRLHLNGDGYELKAERPVTVIVAADQMVVRLQSAD